MAPRDPQKGKKSILMGSLVVLDPNGSPKKISFIFGTGGHKVCTCLLNGAISVNVYINTWFLCERKNIKWTLGSWQMVRRSMNMIMKRFLFTLSIIIWKDILDWLSPCILSLQPVHSSGHHFCTNFATILHLISKTIDRNGTFKFPHCCFVCKN